MNAEQLHGVVRKLHQAHSTHRTIKRVNAARDALQNSISNPGNADVQQTYRGALAALEQVLRDEALTIFSVKDNAILVETGLFKLTGPSLWEGVTSAVNGDQLTPSLAVQQLEQISQRINAQLGSLGQLDQILNDLNVGYDDVEPEEAQAGFYIHRTTGENISFEELIEEQAEINQFVSLATELVTGKSESPGVKLLTASDYGFLLEVVPPVAGFMALAIERALAARKVWLETQLLKRQLDVRGAPTDALKALGDHFERQLADHIRQAVEEAVARFSAISERDKPRERELTNHLTIHVKSIVEKTDRGNYVDLKVGLPTPVAEGDGGTAAPTSLDAARMQEIDHLTRRLHELEHEARGQRRLSSPNNEQGG